MGDFAEIETGGLPCLAFSAMAGENEENGLCGLNLGHDLLLSVRRPVASDEREAIQPREAYKGGFGEFIWSQESQIR
ncbi:hypothetical protein K32_47280 [Kaistia sp. 32K]|nr:hypothetical protein K32_47280 [Kaistia sp. 32K]